jgi:hypothetical protein
MVRSKFAIKALPLAGFVLFSLLLISSAVYFVVAAIVDAQTLAIRFELNQKKNSGTPLNPIDSKRIQSGLIEATNVVYDAPHYWEDLGYLHVNQGYAALRFPFISTPILELANSEYKKTLLTRPMAPVAWSNLALIEHYLNHEKTMWRYFELASKYGANDPAAQLTLFVISLQRWEVLPEDKRRSARRILEEAKGPFKIKLLELLKRYGGTGFKLDSD